LAVDAEADDGAAAAPVRKLRPRAGLSAVLAEADDSDLAPIP